jgi:hypothetical protein
MVGQGTRRRRRPAAADAAPTTPDPIEIAMAAEVSGRAPGEAAIRLIEAQRRLVGWEIADRRSGVALKALSAGLALMAWQASRADGLVVEAFSVPPDLAARGLTGQVVASQILDRFNSMQTVTDSVRPTPRSANDWDLKARVEIPQTGVSIAELERLLRRWLGHERRISGEVVRGPGGLQLTVRMSGGEADTVAGADGDLTPLTTAAAERLYDRTDPTRYAMYLSRTGRAEAARDRLPRLLQTGPPADRAYAHNILGLLTADHAASPISADPSACRPTWRAPASPTRATAPSPWGTRRPPSGISGGASARARLRTGPRRGACSTASRQRCWRSSKVTRPRPTPPGWMAPTHGP